MRKNIIYIFPVTSIISIVITFLFPVLSYESAPSTFYPFWIYGWQYNPFEFIIILDIPHKIISSLIVVIAILTAILIFLQWKFPDRLDVISKQWLWMGIVLIILLLFWILSCFFVAPFITPYSFTFEVVFLLPFISGLLLILGRIFVRVFNEKSEE